MGKRKAGGHYPSGSNPSSDGRAATHGHSNRNQQSESGPSVRGQGHHAPTAAEIVALVEAKTGKPMVREGDEWKGPCPNPACPEGPGTDRFYIRANGKYFCRKCCADGSDKAAFLALTESFRGKRKAKPFTRRWTHTNVRGEQVTVVRQGKGKGKRVFRDPAGIEGPFLPLGQPGKNETAVIVEGEIARDAIRSAGYEGVCWIGGSKNWHKTDWSRLECADVVLWPDNDGTGRNAMFAIGSKLHERGMTLRMVAPPDDVKTGWDAADADHETVHRLIEAAPDWAPTTKQAESFTDRAIFLERGADGFADGLKQLGHEIRCNIRSGVMERRGEETGGKWVEVNEGWVESVRAEMFRRFRLMLKTAPEGARYDVNQKNFRAWMTAITYDAGYVDPFFLWLKDLPEWDGKKRLDGLIGRLFKVAEGEEKLAAWCGRYIFAGAVNRALHPGAAQHESPVFIGKGEVGKSSFVKLTLPAFGREQWYTENFNMCADQQRQLQCILGKVFVEMGEMQGVRRVEHSALKAFLSTDVDNAVRLPYAPAPVAHPRRCIFVGTTDKSSCLPNDDNLRRFVAIRVAAKGKRGPAAFKRIQAYMEANRDQLWAEAVAWIKAGNIPNLPAALRPAAQESAETARLHDSHITDALADQESLLVDQAREKGGLTMTEIVGLLGRSFEEQYERGTRSFEMRLAQELDGLKWVQVRRMREGKRVRLWHPSK